MGRDTDCITAIAAGISGALTGGLSLPKEWIQQVDYATSINPHTNSHRTIKEQSDVLYNAFKARMARLRNYIERMNY